jgi:hypothetical protein
MNYFDNNQCFCLPQIIPIIGALFFISCCTITPNRDEMQQLKIENKNLKNLVLKSFDKVFTDAMKNGNDNQYDDDD